MLRYNEIANAGFFHVEGGEDGENHHAQGFERNLFVCEKLAK